jgi:hypothetical protein
MAFDIEGAKKAGYNDAEIADHLAKQSNFDFAGAKKAGYNDAEILQHLASAPAATPETRAPATDAIPQGRSMRGGFARQVGEALANPAETPRIPTAAELGTRYGDIGKGAVQGVPAAVLGLPGDVASLVVDNPLTSHAIGNAMFGEANPDVAAGRTIGGLVTGFAAPAMAGKLGAAKNALAASYPLAAKGVGAAQLALDPLSPIVAGAINAGARGAKAVGNIGRAAEEAIPSTKAQFESATADFQVLDQSNLAVRPDVLRTALSDVEKSLPTQGYLPKQHAEAKNILDDLVERAQTPQSLTELDNLRKHARDLAATVKSSGERNTLNVIQNKLDDIIKNVDETKVVPKDPLLPTAAPDVVIKHVLEGRDKYRKAIKSEQIETLINNAVINSEGKAASPIKALQTEFSSLARNEDLFAQYSAAEQKIIKDLAAGRVGSSTLRGLENLMPGFSRSSMFGNFMAAVSAAGGASLGGPAGLLAYRIPGAIGKASEVARGAQAVPFANRFAEGIRGGNVELAQPFTSTAAVRNFLRPRVGAYNAFNQQSN